MKGFVASSNERMRTDTQMIRKFTSRSADKRIGRCMLDRAAHRLSDEDGREVPMSPMEFILLKALSDHPDRVLSRERILNLSGQDDWDPLDRSVDLRILRLRKKIEPDPEYPQYILTVRSEGYKFVPGGSEAK